jgi:hypothetical protein
MDGLDCARNARAVTGEMKWRVLVRLQAVCLILLLHGSPNVSVRTDAGVPFRFLALE